MTPSISHSALEALNGRSASGADRTASPDRAETLVVANGTRLRLRPVRPHDRDGIAELFARLSPKSRYRRFLLPRPELTPGELSTLTDVDHVCDEAIAAVDERKGSIVAVGQYVHDPDRPGSASVAFAVDDEFQSMGIGTALARYIVQSARANGFAVLTATTLWENRPARALLRRLGFHACSSQGGVIELELGVSRSRDRSHNPGPSG
jgi:ribosomal protein S18 acetylase RimI-like enzyme